MSFNSIVVRLKGFSRIGRKRCRRSFQFHSGSIKSIDDPVIHQIVTLFQFHSGSIKRNICWPRMTPSSKFQFHSGSIKRYEIGELMITAKEFQFHSGSIKRKAERAKKHEEQSFNSIVVRLKGGLIFRTRRSCKSFNSIVVRLKGEMPRSR